MQRFLLLMMGFLPLISPVFSQAVSDRWSTVQDQRQGTLVIAYSENSPFIYNNEQGELAGIEFEVLTDFTLYLAEEYEVQLNLTYEHLYNFESLMDTLKASPRPLLGIASISTLEERKSQFR